MRKVLRIFSTICLGFILIIACEKDEGILPAISFKTGENYISKDTILPAGTPVSIGVNSSKSEDKDVLKQFNISILVNSGDPVSVFNKSLTGTEGDTFQYDYLTTVQPVAGQKTKYIFTITNRDGLINQISLTITTK